MPSKGIVNRRRVGQALLAAARTHAHDLGERLETHLAAVLEDGETLPDTTHLQTLLTRLQETRLDALGRRICVDPRDRRTTRATVRAAAAASGTNAGTNPTTNSSTHREGA